MRLSALNPDFIQGDSGEGYLSFDCPCGCGDRIARLPTFDNEPRNTGIYRWGLTGAFTSSAIARAKAGPNLERSQFAGMFASCDASVYGDDLRSRLSQTPQPPARAIADSHEGQTRNDVWNGLHGSSQLRTRKLAR